MKYFFRQPNGKYCYFSNNGIERENLSEEDIRRIFIEEAEAEAESSIKNAKNFGEIIEELLRRNIRPCDEWLSKIGFTELYSKLVKYVPRKPINTWYVSCDFTTYGNCPACGEVVKNCMGSEQEKCKCGQRIKWD